ncbi:MAG: hypothetical protein EOM22_08500 [Gammaproteobacteria bacterium]|nr:hypothetical protein [Gammaproteobacteria bacterium]
MHSRLQTDWNVDAAALVHVVDPGQSPLRDDPTTSGVAPARPNQQGPFILNRVATGAGMVHEDRLDTPGSSIAQDAVQSP